MDPQPVQTQSEQTSQPTESTPVPSPGNRTSIAKTLFYSIILIALGFGAGFVAPNFITQEEPIQAVVTEGAGIPRELKNSYVDMTHSFSFEYPKKYTLASNDTLVIPHDASRSSTSSVMFSVGVATFADIKFKTRKEACENRAKEEDVFICPYVTPYSQEDFIANKKNLEEGSFSTTTMSVLKYASHVEGLDVNGRKVVVYLERSPQSGYFYAHAATYRNNGDLISMTAPLENSSTVEQAQQDPLWTEFKEIVKTLEVKY